MNLDYKMSGLENEFHFNLENTTLIATGSELGDSAAENIVSKVTIPQKSQHQKFG